MIVYSEYVEGVTMKKGLVLEGGGIRGIFSAGVLDVLMEEGIDPLQLEVRKGSALLQRPVAPHDRRPF